MVTEDQVKTVNDLKIVALSFLAILGICLGIWGISSSLFNSVENSKHKVATQYDINELKKDIDGLKVLIQNHVK